MSNSVNRYLRVVGVTLAAGLAFVGCATTDGPGPSSAVKTAGAGALAGAGLGAIIGHQSGETGKGAAIGAGAGALGGYLLGNEKDKAQMKAQAESAQAQANEALRQANTVVINVTNTTGSTTPVTLKRQGSLYIGPKGEKYTSLPTEEQLRGVYGF